MTIITNFKDPSGNDLGSIFMPLAGSTTLSNTGYSDTSGNDFSQLFMPLGTYIPLSYLTNYRISNGNDLKAIFANINQPLPLPLPLNIVSNSYSYIYDYSNSMYYITSDTSGTIEFTSDISGNIHFILVGGGGSGGGAVGSQQSSGTGGSGGGSIDAYTNMGGGIIKNKIYNYSIGLGGQGVSGNSGNNGNASYFKSDTTTLIQSNGGLKGIVSTSTTDGPIGSTSTIVSSSYTNSFTGSTGNGGNGGKTTPSANFTGGFGGSSNLSSNYYTNYASTSFNTINYYKLSNTFLIYNIMLFSGGGGGGTEGGSSDGYSAWGGYGLADFGGNIYGYTTNTTYPIIASVSAGYGQNNNPPTSANFPCTSSSLPGIAPGAGGAGVGAIIAKGGNGANGILKIYFNYSSPFSNYYYTLSGNAKYYLMNNGTVNYFIINCWAGTSTINFTTSVSNCIAVVVGGGGGGGSGKYISPNFFSGAGGGGGGAGIYTNITLNGTYNITVGTGGAGGTNAGTSGTTGTNTRITNSSGTIIYSQATAGAGGIYSTSKNALGGPEGTCSGTWTLSTSGNGSGGNGGQGSENGPDPTPLTSANQAKYGSSSSLISYTLPDGTLCYFSGGGGAGSCNYSNGTVNINYTGGGAGHGYGGFVGASYNSLIASTNGQDAKIFGAGGGGGSSNTPSIATTGGRGANGLVLLIVPIN
jgi:hypothetical protein